MPSLDEIRKALAEHSSQRAAARALGIAESTLRGALLRSYRPLERDFVVKRHTASYDGDGNLTGQSITSAPAPGEVFTPLPGHIVKGESVLLDPSGQVIQKWVKTRENAEAIGQLVAELQQAFAAYEGKAPALPPPEHTIEDLLTIYPVPDLHMGLYAWGEECGDDYDTNIATEIASVGLTKLIARSAPSRHAVLLIKGDYFHQNDQKNVTPRSGHRLDVDGRWDKVYLAGSELVLSMINLLLQRHERVELVIIPGNHDEDAALTLRVAMMLYFRGHERVSVYSKPGLFWYRLFGSTLLGAMHGHNMRDPKDMALTMAADCAEEWGKARFRQIFSGHIHHERSREVGPVRWESFQTPAPTDAHARGGGYRSGRSLTAITIHAEDGEVGRHRQPILSRLALLKESV